MISNDEAFLPYHLTLFLRHNPLEKDNVFPQIFIDNKPEVALIARTPISIADKLNRQVAAKEMKMATLWDFDPNIKFPYIVWGTEYGQTFAHTYDALNGEGSSKYGNGTSPSFLAYIKSRWPLGWLAGKPQFALAFPGDMLTQDEYPFGSSAQGGPFNYEFNTVSLRLVPGFEQNKQGGNLGNFYSKALVIANTPVLSWFGVRANLASFDSYWIDRAGKSHPLPPVF